MSEIVEYAPHPEKAEGIFVTAITKAAVESNDSLALDRDKLAEVAKSAAYAWGEYQVICRKQKIANIRATMELVSDMPALRKLASELSLIPQTSAEREASLELFRKCAGDITRTAPGPQPSGPGYEGPH